VISWDVSKCRLFLTGIQHFTVLTDHNPLIPILNSHCLDEVENPCLQQLNTRLMAYNFTAEWRKGSQNNAPDALSKTVPDLQPQDMLAEYDISNQADMSIREIRIIANNALISKVFTGVLQMMNSISSYSALFSVGSQIIAVSFQTKYDVISMYINI